MAEPILDGMAQTVNGLVRPEELGVTLTHEHLMSDAAVLVPPPRCRAQSCA